MSVYRTPWGTRELSDAEATDLQHQGVPLTLVGGDEITADLESERRDLAGVTLTSESGDRIPRQRG